MNELALYAGAGLGLLASKWLLGHRIVCYVERDPYRVEVLKARIRDGLLDDAPIWNDVRTFDGKPWCGCVDIVSAGFPCQPFAAGGKHRRDEDERNGWPDTIRVIREIKPRWVFLENSPNLLSVSRKYGKAPYIETIIEELSEAGYVGAWGCLSASTLGAYHKRERVWIVAYSGETGREILLCGDDGNKSADLQKGLSRKLEPNSLDKLRSYLSRLEERLGEPAVFGNDDGLPYRVDRLGAIGDGQVPIVAATAWRLLTGLR